MTQVSISAFDGFYPRTSKVLIQQNQAQTAINVKLQSGEIKPWGKPRAVYTAIQEGVQTIFKLDGPSGEGAWAEWTCDCDVVYSPMADLTEHRVYYSENGVCKKTNWTMAHDGKDGTPLPRNWYYMGVPRPSVAPTLTPVLDKDDQTAENTENRAYVWTFISTFGNVQEESAPSDAALVECSITGGEVVVSGFPTAPTDHYNITGLRLYRAINGSESISYLMVDQFVYANGKLQTQKATMNNKDLSEDGKFHDDTLSADLGVTMECMYYEEPPEGLKGLVNMPNGMIAGFVGNQVWFCEPYLPHAWPSTYMLTTDSPIVGLGVYGNTLVVCTERQPFTMFGTHPSSMTQEKLPMNQPCVNKRSIAYDQYGVLYASANGLIVIAGGQMDVFTRPLLTRDNWKEYNPTLMVGGMYDNFYFCGYTQGNDCKMLVFARGDTPSLVEVEFDPICLFSERISGDIYGLSKADNKVYRLDDSETNYMTYEWKSKMMSYPRTKSFSCAKIDGEFASIDEAVKFNEERDAIIAYNKEMWTEYAGQSLLGDVNGAMVNTFTVNGGVLLDVPEMAELRYARIEFYGDEELYYSREVITREAFRLPRCAAYNHEVRFAGTVPIRAFMMATSMGELEQQ